MVCLDTILEGDAPDGKFLLRKRPGFPLDYVLTVVYVLFGMVWHIGTNFGFGRKDKLRLRIL